MGQKAYGETLETLEDNCRRAAFAIKKFCENQSHAEAPCLWLERRNPLDLPVLHSPWHQTFSLP